MNLLALGQYNIGSIHKEKGDVEKALPALERGARLSGSPGRAAPVSDRVSGETRRRAIARSRELQHKAHQDGKALRVESEVGGRPTKTWSGHSPIERDFTRDLGLSWNYAGHHS